MAIVAGIGFGGYFVCLARSNAGSGLWPVVISRMESSVLVVPLAATTGRLVRLPPAVIPLALAAGVLDAGANLAFLLASRHGLLSLSGVITALYPAGTVLLAVLLLKERTGRLQRIGLAVAVASVVLITK
jgi:drug/metabolite transporter (DMT)-like permease